MLKLILKNIRLNNVSGLYEVNEASFKYCIDPSLIDSLSKYLKDNPDDLIAHWYRSLPAEVQKKVERKSKF